MVAVVVVVVVTTTDSVDPGKVKSLLNVICIYSRVNIRAHVGVCSWDRPDTARLFELERKMRCRLTGSAAAAWCQQPCNQLLGGHVQNIRRWTQGAPHSAAKTEQPGLIAIAFFFAVVVVMLVPDTSLAREKTG